MRYAVFTSRHHDCYCRGIRPTRYSMPAKAPKRDFVASTLGLTRGGPARGALLPLPIGPSRLLGGARARPGGQGAFPTYVRPRSASLHTNNWRNDVIWFDGAWPHSQADWHSHELVEMIRALQPNTLINNRLGVPAGGGSAPPPARRAWARASGWRFWHARAPITAAPDRCGRPAM
jgi:alpha-L-fucosidase